MVPSRSLTDGPVQPRGFHPTLAGGEDAPILPSGGRAPLRRWMLATPPRARRTRQAGGPHACVVMAHGTSATIGMVTDRYAEAFHDGGPGIDPSRIALWGDSYSAGHALARLPPARARVTPQGDGRRAAPTV
jgi:hypothetical protein